MKNKTALHTERILCPFFRCHNSTEIGCEGITEGSSIRLVFRNAAGQAQQEQIFCGGDYAKCELFRAINEKYEAS